MQLKLNMIMFKHSLFSMLKGSTLTAASFTVSNQPTKYTIMKIELSTQQAADFLLKDKYANWSRNAALALVEYYESLEEDCGEFIKLDAVAIRCYWAEYSSIEEAVKYRNSWYTLFWKRLQRRLYMSISLRTCIVYC